MTKTVKEKLTEIILKELPEKYFEDNRIEKILFRIWVTGRTGNGLRLTDEGMKALEAAEITYYEYPINLKKLLGDVNTKKKANEFTLQLDRKIKCPFYLGMYEAKKKQAYIRVYDSKVAMMINLYGSIEEYLTLTGNKNA